MKFLICCFLFLNLFGCASSENRKPSSYGDSTNQESNELPAAAVIAFNSETNEACLLNQDKYNFYGPATRGSKILPQSVSRRALPQVPACSSKVNAQYQKLAPVAFEGGPQVAGAPFVVGYYLVCTADHVGLDRLDKIDQSKLSETRKTVQNFVYGLGMVAAYTACLPATGVNIGLIYVFTDKEFN